MNRRTPNGDDDSTNILLLPFMSYRTKDGFMLTDGLSLISRRRVLTYSGASLLGASVGVRAAEPDPLVKSIEKFTLQRGRTGNDPTWFHPRACLVPKSQGPMALMTLQTISGSDFFGPVQFMTSNDFGQTWSKPQFIPALGRVKRDDGWDEGVCDVVPEYHRATGTVLAMGHSVCYRGPKFETAQPPRWPVYAIWKDGQWSERRRLEWDDPRGSLIYTNNCGQRVTLPNGDIAFVMTFGAKGTTRSAAGVRCGFDGQTLTIKQVGHDIKHSAGRGLLEPSLIHWRQKFFVTLRAEDNRGYVAASDDGLNFSDKQPWCWENGEPLVMSTTQQHWLAHSDALFLVYTRQHESNTKVFRWRMPVFMAQLDPQTLRLRRDTEQIVLPLVGDGVNAADEVPYSGNFHTTNVTSTESWVTDGEMLPKRGFKGDLLLARIQWSQPNKLVSY